MVDIKARGQRSASGNECSHQRQADVGTPDGRSPCGRAWEFLAWISLEKPAPHYFALELPGFCEEPHLMRRRESDREFAPVRRDKSDILAKRAGSSAEGPCSSCSGSGGSVERETRQLEAHAETSPCWSDGNAANENVFVVVAPLIARAGGDASGCGVACRPQSPSGGIVTAERQVSNTMERGHCVEILGCRVRQVEH